MTAAPMGLRTGPRDLTPLISPAGGPPKSAGSMLRSESLTRGTTWPSEGCRGREAERPSNRESIREGRSHEKRINVAIAGGLDGSSLRRHKRPLR